MWDFVELDPRENSADPSILKQRLKDSHSLTEIHQASKPLQANIDLPKWVDKIMFWRNFGVSKIGCG